MIRVTSSAGIWPLSINAMIKECHDQRMHTCYTQTAAWWLALLGILKRSAMLFNVSV